MSDYIRQQGDLYVLVRKRGGKWRWQVRSYTIISLPFMQNLKQHGAEQSMEKALEVGLRMRKKWLRRL